VCAITRREDRESQHDCGKRVASARHERDSVSCARTHACVRAHINLGMTSPSPLKAGDATFSFNMFMNAATFAPGCLRTK